MTSRRWFAPLLFAAVWLCAAGPARAQTCRKICYSTEGKDENGCCVDKKKLVPVKPKEPEKKCPAGQQITKETAGNCCWPAQVWAGGACRGIPSACPDGTRVEREGCVAAGCPSGQVRMDDGRHCCWPGQVWAESASACKGIPTQCPKNWEARGEGCVAKGIEGFVPLPGGGFGMGSMSGDRDEQPVHVAKVSPFSMSKTESTVAQYRVCVEEGKCKAPAAAAGCNYGQADRDEHPVNCVTWAQADAFCKFAGGRLPTEAEWEYAARSGGKGVTYPWGEEAPTCREAIMKTCRGSGTSPVCTRIPGHTEQGVCDMAGNVWEWVGDWYAEGAYAGAEAEDPTGPDAGTLRVRRGGSFDDAAMRTTDRSASPPGHAAKNIGFRCVRGR